MKVSVGLLAVGLVAAALSAGRAPAQDGPLFQAAPMLIKAGEANAGEGRYYPSPVMQDVNGDGRLDLLIGDLMGRITVAHRLAGEGPPRFSAEEPLKAADGEDLKFHNW